MCSWYPPCARVACGLDKKKEKVNGGGASEYTQERRIGSMKLVVFDELCQLFQFE